MTHSSATPDPAAEDPTLHDDSLTSTNGPAVSVPERGVMFVDWSRPRQAWESVGGALVTGALAGLLLGYAWWAYLIAVAVAVIGGFPSGAQHRTLPGALARGFVGGAVWALGVVVVSEVSGRNPTVALPDPAIAFLLWGIIPACLIGAISWWLGRRRRGR